MARFFDDVTAMGVDAIMVSPGYAYERAPDQQHFLNRRKTKELFRGIFARGKGKGWKMGNRPLFLDFLAGNQTLPLHALGQPDAQHLRLAAALLPARRGLCEDLRRADGDHRLGQVRHRQLREMRRLHGAFRLRGDGGGGCREAALEGRRPRRCAARAPRARWRRRSTCSQPAPGRVRVQPPCRSRRWREMAHEPPRRAAAPSMAGRARRQRPLAAGRRGVARAAGTGPGPAATHPVPAPWRGLAWAPRRLRSPASALPKCCPSAGSRGAYPDRGMPGNLSRNSFMAFPGTAIPAA